MINWGSLLVVQLVSFGSTIAMVVLVSVAVLGLSGRDGDRVAASTSDRHPTTSRTRSGTAVAVTCLSLAAMVVLFGLWEIVAR